MNSYSTSHYFIILLTICLFVVVSCSKTATPIYDKPLLNEEFKDFNHPLNRTLNLKTRDPEALKGSKVVEIVENLNLEDREAYIFEQVIQGNIPGFLREMHKVSSRIQTGEGYIYATYYALPDYLAIGSDEDYFLCPLTPGTAQKIADELDCFLPTKRMVDHIWEAAPLKLTPKPIPPTDQMTTVSVFDDHNEIVKQQRMLQMNQHNLGTLVSGHKKDVIISNLIQNSPDPARVIIYGWHEQNGKPIQPIYAGHHANYADYSHGIRLIHNELFINEVKTSASDVLKSKELKSLLSNEGIIESPYYPLDN